MWAATILVPDQYPTIQAAILAASAGDSVVVRPDTYVENINYRFKQVAVVSEAGPAATIIDGSQPIYPDSGTVAIINADGALLEGFTIRGGTGTLGLPPAGGRSAGGIAIFSRATLRRNWITENHVRSETVFGGAVYVLIGGGGGYEISDNRIYSNSTEWTGSPSGRGGAITAVANSGLIDHNEIFDNSTNTAGGIYFLAGSAIVSNNVIACNQNGGIWGGHPVVANTIVSNTVFGVHMIPPIFNRNTITHNLGYGVNGGCGGPNLGSCNNFFANAIEDSVCFGPGTENISVDPMYGEVGCPGSYCLLPGSPLLPENSPADCGLIGAVGACEIVAIDAPTSPDYSSGPLVARPNPFNPSTSLGFRLTQTRHVTLEVHDASGRTVCVLLDRTLPPGDHQVTWDGRDGRGIEVASGAYIAVLRSPVARFSQKLLLVK